MSPIPDQHIIDIQVHLECKKEFPQIESFIDNVVNYSLSYIEKTESIRGPFEVSISIITDSEMKMLNYQYRNKNYSTDVLSFSQLEGESFSYHSDQPLLLGDIIISYQTCKKQSMENQIPFFFELARLLIHGLYHLLGYDHERSQTEEIIMQEKEKQLMEFLHSTSILQEN